MCIRGTCANCNKASWWGCSKHVPAVMDPIPPEERYVWLLLPSSPCIFCFLAGPCLNEVFILLGLRLAISLFYYLNFLTSLPVCQISVKSSLTSANTSNATD